MAYIDQTHVPNREGVEVVEAVVVVAEIGDDCLVASCKICISGKRGRSVRHPTHRGLISRETLIMTTLNKGPEFSQLII